MASSKSGLASPFASPDTSTQAPMAGHLPPVEEKDYAEGAVAGGGNPVSGRSDMQLTLPVLGVGDVSPPGTPTTQSPPILLPADTTSPPPVLKNVPPPPLLPSVVEPRGAGRDRSGSATGKVEEKAESDVEVLNVLIVDDDLLSRQLLSRYVSFAWPER